MDRELELVGWMQFRLLNKKWTKLNRNDKLRILLTSKKELSYQSKGYMTILNNTKRIIN